MQPKTARLAIILCASLAAAEASAAQAGGDALARKAYLVLRRHCYACHGVQRLAFNVLRHEELLESGYVAPKELDSSEIWVRAGKLGDMPPARVVNRPTADEIDILKRWIEAGAERFPPEEPRTPISEASVLQQIAQHLEGLPQPDRTHQRYFTLSHLYNNLNVTDDELRLYRAALSKTINSLSRKREIAVPAAIDKEQTIYVLDLRRVGWDNRPRWLEVLKAYPYGLKWREPALAELVERIQRLWSADRLQADQIPYLRADWFVVKASRPPVYDALLELPATDTALEQQLGVDFKRDFTNGDLVRAAVTQSGVSHHNRLIDRHVGTGTAYYYKSFDFGKGNGLGLLAQRPLGPFFQGNPFVAAKKAFKQDGGEVVFSLPNGLQGYLIVDGNGARIPQAPVDVVRDLKEISGSPAVVNGISCIGCHTRGIQRYEDNLAPVVRLSDEAGQKFAQLFKPNEKLASLQQEDTDRFLAAAKAATGPFLLVGEAAGKQVTDFPEPVSALAEFYNGAVSLETAASELAVNADTLREVLLHNGELEELGLRPLSAGFRIARDLWDSRADGDSVFQKAARALGKALPSNVE